MISILYVDDEPGLVALLRHYLQQTGEFQVLTAGSGPEALALLERHPVDVVVSDYQMPGMNGIELLRECRRRFDGLPFILFTGRGREEVVIEAIEYGVDFYLQKGGDPEAQFAELALKCRQAVRWRRAEEELRASEERNRRIIEGSPTGIHMYELEERLPGLSRRKPGGGPDPRDRARGRRRPDHRRRLPGPSRDRGPRALPGGGPDRGALARRPRHVPGPPDRGGVRGLGLLDRAGTDRGPVHRDRRPPRARGGAQGARAAVGGGLRGDRPARDDPEPRPGRSSP